MSHRVRIAPDARREVAARAQAPADPTARALLRLQRAAGNAAVAGLIGKRRLARRRVLPSDPTSFADYAAVRGEISVDTASHSVGDVKELFRPKGARFNPRSGYDVSYHFSKDIAADTSKQSVIEVGLENIARAVFNLADTSKEPVQTGATTFLNLDLAGYGGHDGRYRFTSVAGEKAKQVEILIEYLGPAPQPLSTWDALGKDAQGRLSERFGRFGFAWGDGDVGWSNDKKAQVMQAIALIPDAVLQEVSGISWERGRAKLGPDGEGGRYEPTGRKIILYSDAFSDDWGLIELVAHELGHGLSLRPQERAHSATPHQDEPEYRKAAGAVTSAPTAYGRKSFKEDFAEGFALFIEEPDTLKALRPELFDYFTKLVAGLSAPAKASSP